MVGGKGWVDDGLSKWRGETEGSGSRLKEARVASAMGEGAEG